MVCQVQQLSWSMDSLPHNRGAHWRKEQRPTTCTHSQPSSNWRLQSLCMACLLGQHMEWFAFQSLGINEDSHDACLACVGSCWPQWWITLHCCCQLLIPVQSNLSMDHTPCPTTSHQSPNHSLVVPFYCSWHHAPHHEKVSHPRPRPLVET